MDAGAQIASSYVYLQIVVWSCQRIDYLHSSSRNQNARRALETYDTDVLERRADAPEPSPTNPGGDNQNLPPSIKVALFMTGNALCVFICYIGLFPDIFVVLADLTTSSMFAGYLDILE